MASEILRLFERARRETDTGSPALYMQTWTALLQYLSDDEPATRLVALRTIGRGVDDLTARYPQILLSLSSLCISILRTDELPVNRFLAADMLGRLSAHLDASIASKALEDIFSAINQCFNMFSAIAETKKSSKTQVDHQDSLIEDMTRFIGALSHFVNSDAACTAEFSERLDKVLHKICMHTQASQSLVASVFSLYAKLSHGDEHRVAALIPLFVSLSRPSSSANSSLASKTVNKVTILSSALSSFALTWYREPTDNLLQLCRDPLLVNGQARSRVLNFLGPLPTTPAIPGPQFSFCSSDEHTEAVRCLSSAPAEFLPEQYDLSFRLGSRNIALTSSNHRKELQIFNRSKTKSHFFFLQVHPRHLFTVQPAFGSISPQSSLALTIELTNSSICEEDVGFIKLRSVHGFELEHIEIKYRVGHSIEVPKRAVDFGFCSLFTARTLQFYVKNTSAFAWSAIIHHDRSSVVSAPQVPPPQAHQQQHQAPSRPIFQVLTSSVYLQPGEIRSIDVVYYPHREQEDLDTVTITSGGVDSGSATTVISLRGNGINSQPNCVLDFGLMAPQEKRAKSLHFEGRDAYPIIFSPKTKHLSFAQPTPSRPTFHVTLSSKQCGPIRSIVSAHSPGLPPLPIEISAHIGDVLISHACRHIQLPPIVLGSFHKFSIPLTNLSSRFAEFTVDGLAGYPIYFRLRSAKKIAQWNQHGMREVESFKEVKEPIPTFPNFIAIKSSMLRLPPHSTSYLDFFYQPRQLGFLSIPMSINCVQPIRKICGTFDFQAYTFKSGELLPLADLQKEHPVLESIPADPVCDKDRGFTPAFISTPNASSELPQRNQHFSISDKKVWIPFGKSHSLIIQNHSAELRELSAFVSFPFHFEMGSELPANLKAGESIEVPIKVGKLESDTQMLRGHLTLFDPTDQSTPLIASELCAVFGHLVQVIRPPSELKFEPVEFGQPSYFTFALNNCTDEFMAFSIQINDIILTSQKPLSGFFSMESFLPLQPFEHRLVSIKFLCQVSGTFSANVSVSYLIPHTSPAEKALSDSFSLQAWSGFPSFQFEKKFIDFGLCQIGEPSDLVLKLSNTGLFAGIANLVSSSASFVSPGEISIDANGEKEFPVTFTPTYSGLFSGTISVYTENNQFAVCDVFGSGGVSMLSTNFGKSIQEDPTAILDFGYLRAGAEMIQKFVLQNCGDLSIKIDQIKFDSEAGISLFEQDSENTLQALSKMIVIEPAGSVAFTLKICNAAVGRVQSLIRISCACGTSTVFQERFVFRVAFNIQEPLSASCKKVEFGNVPIPMTASQKITLKNIGTEAMPFQLSFVPSPEDLQANASLTRRSFRCVPDHGLVLPNAEIPVEIFFAPIMAHHQVQSILVASVPLVGETRISVTGVGATADLKLSQPKIDFLCIRKGTSKTQRIVVTNVGELSAHFRITTTSKFFSIIPSSGVIKPRCEEQISIVFSPQLSVNYSASLQISWGRFSQELTDSATVELIGAGGLPELSIRTVLVDFGLCLIDNDNFRNLRVYNTGNAEAVAHAHFPEETFSIEGLQVFSVPAKGFKDLVLIYHPTSTNHVDSSIFVSEVESATERIPVRVTTRVGFTSISISPSLALTNLDFGIAYANEVHTRSFSIVNEGTISVSFTAMFFKKQSMNEDQEGQSAIEIVEPASKQPVQMTALARTNRRIQDHIKFPTEAAFPHSESEEVTPELVTISPAKGTFAPNSAVRFVVSYSPTADFSDVDYVLAIAHEANCLSGVVRGSSGYSSMEIDTPTRLINFGVCRFGGYFARTITISNQGNIPYDIVLGPDPEDPAWPSGPLYTRDVAGRWRQALGKLGFRIDVSGGAERVPAGGETKLTFIFDPATEQPVDAKVRISHARGAEMFELRAQGGMSKLTLTDSNGTFLRSIDKREIFDFGTCPKNSTTRVVLLLNNLGTLTSEFFVRRRISPEFSISPQNGIVPPGGRIPILVSFMPVSSGLFSSELKIFDNNRTPAFIRLLGRGGDGIYSLRFLQRKDEVFKGLDFDVVNMWCHVEKVFCIVNSGSAPLHLKLSTSNKAFSLSIASDPEPYLDDAALLQSATKLQLNVAKVNEWTPDDFDHVIATTKNAEQVLPAYFFKAATACRLRQDPNYLTKTVEPLLQIEKSPSTKKKNDTPDYLILESESDEESEILPMGATAATVNSSDQEESAVEQLEITLDPLHFVSVGVKLGVDAEKAFSSIISILSEFSNMSMPLKAQGGSVQIAHDGNLEFGNIATKRPYSRRLMLTNKGSIPCNAKVYWVLHNRPEYLQSRSAIVELDQTGVNRVRIWWRRAISAVMNLMQIWRKKHRGAEHILMPEANSVFHSNIDVKEEIRISELMASRELEKVPQDEQHQSTSFELATKALKQKGMVSSAIMHGIVKRVDQKVNAGLNPTLFALIEAAKSETSLFGRIKEDRPVDLVPQLCAVPATLTLNRGTRTELFISANMPASTLGQFQATLVIDCDSPGVPQHRIPFSASPSDSEMIIDQDSFLDFGRVPIGQISVLTRNISNHGTLPIKFKVENLNSAIFVAPMEGVIMPKKSRAFKILFRPIDEVERLAPIVVDSDCTVPVHFSLYAAGGMPRLHLSNPEYFDFGRCLVGKSTMQKIRMSNIGNATLPVLSCHIPENLVFFKGERFPSGRFDIHPGDFVDLNIAFFPLDEDTFSGQLIIETIAQTVALELLGTGREAALVFDRAKIEFLDCLCGNSYVQEFCISNSGELNYPLTLSLEGAEEVLNQDVQLSEQELVLGSYEKRKVRLTYVPTREVHHSFKIRVDSIYSNHTLDCLVSSGSADLRISNEVIDFGVYELGSLPIRSLKLENFGSMGISFRFVQPPEGFQLPYALSRWEGRISSSNEVDIIIKATCADIGAWSEELCLESNLLGLRYFIRVQGDCQQAIARPTDFEMLTFGDCAVGELCRQTMILHNDGGFPLEFTVRASYPLRITPRTGFVEPLSSLPLIVSWQPGGSFELVSSIDCMTNAGAYAVQVRGAGVLPKFILKESVIDFGACATGTQYERSFLIVNKGLVPVSWSITNFKNDSFSVSPTSGRALVGESSLVHVTFLPRFTGAHTFSTVIECRGRYRELACLGSGGKFDLRTPSKIDLGDCACGQLNVRRIKIRNQGDVPLNLKISCILQPVEGLSTVDTYQIVRNAQPWPSELHVAPQSDANFIILVDILRDAPSASFSFSVNLSCHEGSLTVPAEGIVSIIELSHTALAMLAFERPLAGLQSIPALSFNQRSPNHMTRPLRAPSAYHLEDLCEELKSILAGADLPVIRPNNPEDAIFVPLSLSRATRLIRAPSIQPDFAVVLSVFSKDQLRVSRSWLVPSEPEESRADESVRQYFHTSTCTIEEDNDQDGEQATLTPILTAPEHVPSSFAPLTQDLLALRAPSPDGNAVVHELLTALPPILTPAFLAARFGTAQQRRTKLNAHDGSLGIEVVSLSHQLQD